MKGLGRHWNLKHRQVDLVHVLHRPVEVTLVSRRSRIKKPTEGVFARPYAGTTEIQYRVENDTNGIDATPLP
jgi:hypothetical protein